MQVSLLGTSGSGSILLYLGVGGEEREEKRDITRGLARLLGVNKCTRWSPVPAFSSICVSHIAGVPVFFSLLRKPLRHLSSLGFESASWLAPHVHMEMRSNHASEPGAHFLAIAPLAVELSCSRAWKRAPGQTRQQEGNNQTKSRQWQRKLTFVTKWFS